MKVGRTCQEQDEWWAIWATGGSASSCQEVIFDLKLSLSLWFQGCRVHQLPVSCFRVSNEMDSTPLKPVVMYLCFDWPFQCSGCFPLSISKRQNCIPGGHPSNLTKLVGSSFGIRNPTHFCPNVSIYYGSRSCSATNH